MMKCNPEEQKGYIHSTESFGTVDGPGIRFVIFFQGCPLRCKYCHNPDTWQPNQGNKMTVGELLELYQHNERFYQKGGITATGGEPLMQLAFLTSLFTEAKKRGIHTCLDTSGIVYTKSKREEFEKLFAVTDLVLLDVKHSDPKGHKELTGQDQEPVLAFAKALEEARVPMIVRHVIVPGITDGKEELAALGHLIGKFRNLKGLEVLPYHTMGEKKYEQLGIPYPLRGVEAMDKKEAGKARELLLKIIMEERKNMMNKR